MITLTPLKFSRKLPLLLPLFGAIVLCLSVVPHVAFAAEGDVENGEAVYLKRCVGCHGIDGDGLGPGYDRLVPPPRDFTSGMFKIMSTAFDGYVPQDQDIYEMIRLGMPGTAMPGWADVLSEQDMWDLVAYLKMFPGYDEETPGPVVDYGEQVAISAESIEIGKTLFLEDDRCSECHGDEGKGDAIKRLLGDNGERTWPRNLTKPWTFLHSNDPKDVFTRISVGIPGTQMPSFADPASKLQLSIEERWHVANYVNSLAKTVEVVSAENTVVKSHRLDGEIADDPEDAAWQEATPTTFFLVPQLIAKTRHFTPSNDTITARSLYNDDEIAVLLKWDDRTLSLPGDEDAEKIADSSIYEDQVAIQLPVNPTKGAAKPYFVLGDKERPVSLWRWRSGTTTEPQSASVEIATGPQTPVEPSNQTVQANGRYESGTWTVLFRQKLNADHDSALTFAEGEFIPMAFAVWDGSNSETETKHTLTTWYWMLPESSSTALPFIGAILALLIVIGLEMLWLRAGARKREAEA
ncbi:MAG: c-type cytochrome [Gammaproteobacteria bacterium]|nr:c-type cytochrome [Gammaproteobacteria bacterium]MBT4494852.1 c-type cytochrome [Gammaproteobacteria bacterium]MBT7370820.1 c-type cytochrome [Gammaproteobacteria bacterium]